MKAEQDDIKRNIGYFVVRFTIYWYLEIFSSRERSEFHSSGRIFNFANHVGKRGTKIEISLSLQMRCRL